MSISETKKTKHVAITIVIGFIGATVLFACSLFFPPDMSKIPPDYPEASLIFIEISGALYIFGCTVIGLKLAEEKKTLPAAGFTMMAIGQGVVFVLNFLNFDTTENLVEGYKSYCGSIYLLLPAMILIAFYSEYPRWLNMLGISALIPHIIVYIKFMKSHQYSVSMDQISFISYVLLNITSFFWGIFAYRNMKKEMAELNGKN